MMRTLVLGTAALALSAAGASADGYRYGHVHHYGHHYGYVSPVFEYTGNAYYGYPAPSYSMTPAPIYVPAPSVPRTYAYAPEYWRRTGYWGGSGYGWR
jgi:hypothetical protein